MRFQKLQKKMSRFERKKRITLKNEKRRNKQEKNSEMARWSDRKEEKKMHGCAARTEGREDQRRVPAAVASLGIRLRGRRPGHRNCERTLETPQKNYPARPWFQCRANVIIHSDNIS